MERVSYQRQGLEEERGATWRKDAEATTQSGKTYRAVCLHPVLHATCVSLKVFFLNTSSFFAHAESQLRT